MSIIPSAALEQHLIILGKTGAGKSYALRGIIESLIEDKKRVCIIDPKGDHWGVKLNQSGKGSGYPFVIFGGDHADVPLNSKIGKEVAELIATGNRPSIIDFRGWMPGDRTSFWIDFASTLFRLNRSPLWLIIDEVHNFAPQGKVIDPQAGKSLHWTNRIASEGRGIGIRLFMASQRPQKVHKDTLTCAETLVAMRVVHPLDRKAIKEWIDGIGDPEKGNLVINSIASLQKGDAFIWSPEIQYFKQDHFPLTKTFDSFKAPGLKQETLSGWASINIEDVKKKLSKVIEEAKENDPSELKRKIRELERNIKGNASNNYSIDNKTRKLLVELKKENHSLKLQLKTIDSKHNYEIKKYIMAFHKIGKLASVFLSEKVSEKTETSIKTDPTVLKDKFVDAHITGNNYKTQTILDNIDDENEISPGEKKLLTVMAQYPDGVDNEQITVLTGYKATSRYEYTKKLLSKGFCYRDNSGKKLFITESGLVALGDYEPLPVGEDLRNYWLQNLPPGELKLYEVIIGAYPETLSRSELKELTGYKSTSIYENSKKLKNRKLIVVDSRGITASDNLF